MNDNELIKSISDSKKYRDLNYKTIENVCKLFTYNEQKVREKLHQIWGAYYSTRPNFSKLIEKLDQNEIQLTDLLKIHSSTAERVEEFKDIFDYISQNTKGNSFADLGSGFNPIFFILLGKKEVEYACYDIDNKQQEFVSKLFEEYEMPLYKAIVADVLCEIIKPVDIILAFKLLPVLDQISKEQADQFLRNLKCKYLVVSFPNKSLGGREKGMKQNYRDLYIPRIQNFGFTLTSEKVFKNESIFIFEK